MKIALFTAIVLSVVMAFFAVQNAQTTQVSFLGWYFDAPLVIVLILTFGAGVLVTFLALLPRSVRKSIEIAGLMARLEGSESRYKALEQQAPINNNHEKETHHEQQR